MLYYMGFIILLAVGAALGWLAAIVLRIDKSARIFACIGLGSAGSMATGFIASDETVIAAISPNALLFAVLGAVAVLGIYGLFRNQLSIG